MLISHGSGSYGHAAAAGSPLGSAQAANVGSSSAADRTDEVLAAASRTQAAASRLHALLRKELAAAGIETFSLAPSSFVVADDGVLGSGFTEALDLCLSATLVPLIYGDVILDRRRGAVICSTETLIEWLLDVLSDDLRVSRVLWMGATDGILDQRGQRIDHVSRESLASALEATGGSGGIDTTGGMRHRLQAAWSCCERGVPSWILDGSRESVLLEALRGHRLGGTAVSMIAT